MGVGHGLHGHDRCRGGERVGTVYRPFDLGVRPCEVADNSASPYFHHGVNLVGLVRNSVVVHVVLKLVLPLWNRIDAVFHPSLGVIDEFFVKMKEGLQAVSFDKAQHSVLSCFQRSDLCHEVGGDIVGDSDVPLDYLHHIAIDLSFHHELYRWKLQALLVRLRRSRCEAPRDHPSHVAVVCQVGTEGHKLPFVEDWAHHSQVGEMAPPEVRVIREHDVPRLHVLWSDFLNRVLDEEPLHPQMGWDVFRLGEHIPARAVECAGEVEALAKDNGE